MSGKIKNFFSQQKQAIQWGQWNKVKEDEKWTKMVIDYLLMKLEKKSKLDDLKKVVATRTAKSPCITVKPNSDGKFEVKNYKNYPHIIYCKVWRWPDIKSIKDLHSVDHCQFPFGSVQSEVCINPYHYERGEKKPLPPIIIPTRSELSPEQAPVVFDESLDTLMPQNVELPLQEFSSNNYDEMDIMGDQYVPASPLLPYCGIQNITKSSNEHSLNGNNHTGMINNYASSSNFQNIGEPSESFSSPIQSVIQSSNESNSYPSQPQNNGLTSAAFSSPQQNVLPSFTTAYHQSENNLQLPEAFSPPLSIEQSPGSSSPALSIGQLSDEYSFTSQNDRTIPQFSSSPQSVEQSSDGYFSSSPNNDHYPERFQYHAQSIDGDSSSSENVAASEISEYQQEPACYVPYQDPVYWATITYYELNLRVGEAFNCKTPCVHVDGFTHPNKDEGRFCLGRLSATNRNSTIENTRRHIGKGVYLHYMNGEVFVECASESAVFVQSKSCNYSHGFAINSVCKIPSKCSLKIFNNYDFAKLLSDSVNKGYRAVYELTKMCTIRLSFVKGWGAHYHRQDVTSTPCWIEIHLNGPLLWLDNVLNEMEAPVDRISSVS